MENAKKFFEESIRTEKAKEIFDSLKKPENEEEAIAIYSEVAGKLGIELSAEEIKEYLAAKNASGEIDDDELSQLVGGAKGHEDCRNTYMDRENCWWNDACDKVITSRTIYTEYICSWNSKCTESFGI